MRNLSKRAWKLTYKSTSSFRLLRHFVERALQFISSLWTLQSNWAQASSSHLMSCARANAKNEAFQFKSFHQLRHHNRLELYSIKEQLRRRSSQSRLTLRKFTSREICIRSISRSTKRLFIFTLEKSFTRSSRSTLREHTTSANSRELTLKSNDLRELFLCCIINY